MKNAMKTQAPLAPGESHRPGARDGIHRADAEAHGLAVDHAVDHAVGFRRMQQTWSLELWGTWSFGKPMGNIWLKYG